MSRYLWVCRSAMYRMQMGNMRSNWVMMWRPLRRWLSQQVVHPFPKMGATGFAYDLARKFGLKIVEPRPALVPLTLGGEEVLFRELSGVSAPVIAKCGKTEFREAALFTHRGLSGPAILQISSYWKHGEPISIDFLPDLTSDWLYEAKRNMPKLGLKRAIGAASARSPDRNTD